MTITVSKHEDEGLLINQENFLDYAKERDFGDFHFKIDNETGLIAIIAIHSTKLGPALGGCRMLEYTSPFEALYDAMRLARGMSYKSAIVNLPLGGGKSVIMKPKGMFSRAQLFRKFGEFVNELGGRYITSVDSGTSLTDMDEIAKATPYVASLSTHNAEPSPFTAIGVVRGIEAAVKFKLGKDSLQGLHVAIQGVGKVGYHIAEMLHQRGAKLSVADINQEQVNKAVEAFGATSYPVDKIHSVECDIFSPCALGAIINDLTFPELKAPIIAGSANNQLARAYHGQMLHDKGILYATDYLINAGGLIYACSQYNKAPEAQAHQKIDEIYNSLLAVFERSERNNKPTSLITDEIAKERIA